jgi:hypothetical protein
MDKLNVILETFETLNDSGKIDEGLYLSSCNALKDIASSIGRTTVEPGAGSDENVLRRTRTPSITPRQREVYLSYSTDWSTILTEEYRLDNTVHFRTRDTPEAVAFIAAWTTIKNWLEEDTDSTRRAIWKMGRTSSYQSQEIDRIFSLVAFNSQMALIRDRVTISCGIHPELQIRLSNSIFGRAATFRWYAGTFFNIHTNYNQWLKTKSVRKEWSLTSDGLHCTQTKPTMRKVNVRVTTFKSHIVSPTIRKQSIQDWSFWTDRIQLGRINIVAKLTMLGVMDALDEFCTRMDETCSYTMTHPDLETYLIAFKKSQSHTTMDTTLKLAVSGMAGKTIGKRRSYESSITVNIDEPSRYPYIIAEFDEIVR